MDALKVLSLLEQDKVKEAKDYLREIVFLNQKTPSEKSRYSAMKRYIKYATMHSPLKLPSYPNSLELGDVLYHVFISSPGIVFTKEDIGEIKSWNDVEHFESYPTDLITELFNLEKANGKKVDLSSVILEAKTKGYKLVKQEISDYRFLFKTESNSLYKLTNIDLAYSIIEDGTLPTLYTSVYNNNEVLIIETSIGYACLLRLVFYGNGYNGKSIYNLSDYTRG